MKTFQRVPPQSTEYRELFAFGAASSEVQTQANKSELQVSFPEVSTAKNSAWVGTSQCSHPTWCPHTPTRSSKPQALPAPFSSRQSHSPVVPPAQHQPTNSCTSQKHYYMINTPVFPNDTIHNSSAPGIHFSRYQVLLHTCCWDPWDQQHQRIHLVTQNKQIIAGLFQVSFGSVLKQHDFSSPGFRKGVWLWA